jgi:hypothetical protein
MTDDMTMREKQEIVRNDCYLHRAESELGATGRFAKAGLTKQAITGSNPHYQVPRLPESSPWSGRDDRDHLGERLGPTEYTTPYADPWHEPNFGVGDRAADNGVGSEPRDVSPEPRPPVQLALNDDNSSRVVESRFRECMATVTPGSAQYRGPSSNATSRASAQSKTTGPFIRRA